jgi:hypothetical protein
MLKKPSLLPFTYQQEVKQHPRSGQLFATPKLNHTVEQHRLAHPEQANGKTWLNLQTRDVVYAPQGTHPQQAKPGPYKPIVLNSPELMWQRLGNHHKPHSHGLIG